MNLEEILRQLQDYVRNIKDLDQKVAVLNQIRKALTEVSPFCDQPVDCVLWVREDTVKANEYNPNHVAAPEMKLLHTSIKEDGYTMPIVTYDMQDGYREIVDGFHRNRVEREYTDIHKRLQGYLPVTTLDKPLTERIASTIRHNRARGTHGIRPMSDIVLDLARAGWSDDEICKKLGMELDEVVRPKQITRLREAFMNHEFSRSWAEFEHKYYEGNDDDKNEG